VYAWRRAVAGQRGSDSRYLGQLLGTAASGMILPVSNAMTGPVASYLAEPSIDGRTAKLCRGSDQLSLWLWSRCRTRESGTWLRNRSGAESRQSDLVAGTGSAPGRKVTDGNRPCAMTIT